MNPASSTPRNDSSEPEDDRPEPETWKPRRFPHLPPFSPTARILLLILGWTLIVLGIAGLVLPILQGWLSLALGAAALSLVSRRMLDFLRYLFRPWPRAWRAVLRARRRVHSWFRSRRD